MALEPKFNNKKVTHGIYRIEIGWFFPKRYSKWDWEKLLFKRQNKTKILCFLPCEFNNVYNSLVNGEKFDFITPHSFFYYKVVQWINFIYYILKV